MNSNGFLTVIVLASTEQASLKKTIQSLLNQCSLADICEMIIYLISDDCPAYSTAQEVICDKSYPVSIRLYIQQMPGLSLALFEIPQHVSSSHFLIIASDLEMDPSSVPEMIKISQSYPQAIVCASKFQKGAHRKKYGMIHYLCNRTVNTLVKQILHIKGTELISTFQIYPMSLYRKMGFTDPKRAFYEYTIRPLTYGAQYIEIPTNYIRRSEGASNFNPRKYIDLGVTFITTALHERKLMKNQKREL